MFLCSVVHLLRCSLARSPAFFARDVVGPWSHWSPAAIMSRAAPGICGVRLLGPHPLRWHSALGPSGDRPLKREALALGSPGARPFLPLPARRSHCDLRTAAPALEALGRSATASSAHGHSCARTLRRSALSALCCFDARSVLRPLSARPFGSATLSRAPPLRSSKLSAAWSRPVRGSAASALGSHVWRSVTPALGALLRWRSEARAPWHSAAPALGESWALGFFGAQPLPRSVTPALRSLLLQRLYGSRPPSVLSHDALWPYITSALGISGAQCSLALGRFSARRSPWHSAALLLLNALR